MLFRDHIKLCVLTERRVFQPYGLAGGEFGKYLIKPIYLVVFKSKLYRMFITYKGSKGRNTFIKRDGTRINLGSKSEIDAEPGVY